ncbi:MAG: hypothetical protein IPG93_11165 [Burkholderiales bacterium]|nr:hypothetical protein [Burkholderiales bacterium]
MMSRRLFVAAGLVLAVLGAPAQADGLAAPTGKVVLTLTGKVGKTNNEARAEFDMAMLEALPQQSFTTNTPWYKEPRKFTGPLLRDVLAAAGASGKSLKAVALNDYKVALPADDTDRYGVIVARLLDDKPMPVRDKGPLFIIYPFDTDATLRSERYYSRAAWQLKSIEID